MALYQTTINKEKASLLSDFLTKLQHMSIWYVVQGLC